MSRYAVLRGLSSALVLTALLWLLVGFDRVVSDHEIGVNWEPFIKRSFTFESLFSNPAQQALEIIPFDQLPLSKKDDFHSYCRVRFGEADVAKCYSLIREKAL